ncbi:aldo/keto reductase [[Eubacterium] cellulosolvens]
MEYLHLGKTGIKISRIGLGTFQASRRHWGDQIKLDEVANAIKKSYEMGVNFIDTAETYGDGDSEEVVGKAIRELGRDNLVIGTKVHGKHCRYKDVLRAAYRSLQKLSINEIDLYQIHWPDPWEQIPLKQTMEAVERLYKEGKIRSIGVCNFAIRDIKEAQGLLSSTEIVSNQVRYNLLQREAEYNLLDYCKRKGMTLFAWSPLAQGILTGKYTIDKKPSDAERKGNRLFYDHNLKQISRVLDVLEKISKARRKTMAQVAINWLLRDKTVVPIPGAKNSQQAEENIAAFGWSLNDEEIREIDDIFNTIELSYYKFYDQP